MKLDNAAILLTGASGGIGQALALALAKKGARLFLHGRDAAVLTSLKMNLPHGERHRVVTGDLCSAADRQELTRIIGDAGDLDVLINNAGVNRFAWLEDQSEAQIARQIDLNVLAPIMLTRAILPSLSQSGIVMNIGSSLGDIGFAGYSVYCAGKFAIRGFSESLNRELHGTGHKVLYFAPRATRTALNSEVVNGLNAALGTQSDSVEWVARQAVIALEKETVRRWLGWPERLFVKLNAVLPGAVDRALARQHQTITRYARSAENTGNRP